MEKTKLVPYLEKCCGCRICELMCTFHHKGGFGRKASSIQVKRLERKGEFEIVIHKSKGNLYLACDLCRGEDALLCVRFCPCGALAPAEE